MFDDEWSPQREMERCGSDAEVTRNDAYVALLAFFAKHNYF